MILICLFTCYFIHSTSISEDVNNPTEGFVLEGVMMPRDDGGDDVIKVMKITITTEVLAKCQRLS